MAHTAALDRAELPAPPVVPVDPRATSALRYAEVRLTVERSRRALQAAEEELATVVDTCQQAEDAMLRELLALGPSGALGHALAFGDAAGALVASRRRLDAAQQDLEVLLQDEKAALEELAAACTPST